MRVNLMMKLSYTTSAVGLLEELSSLFYQDGWISQLCISQFGIQDGKSHGHTQFQILKFSVWEMKKVGCKSGTQLSKQAPMHDQPTNTSQNAFLKEGSNLWFCSSLRDIIDNSSARYMNVGLLHSHIQLCCLFTHANCLRLELDY